MLRRVLILALVTWSFCGFSQNTIAYVGAAELSSSEEKSPKNISNTSGFSYADGLILIDAFVNEKPGKFILDTGAPGLILNSNERTGKTIPASSINSSISVEEVVVKNFQWGNFKKRNIAGYALDISHMGKGSSESPDGLIGYQILKNNSIMVNFSEKEISLLSGKDLKKKVKSSSSYLKIPFTTAGHLPVVKLKIGGKVYRFALDTGAEKNVIDQKLFEKTNPQNVKYELLQGLDGSIRKAAVGELENLKSKKYEIEKMQFLYTDLSAVTTGEFGYRIDGLLGLPFFQNKTFVIDYRKGELLIWE